MLVEVHADTKLLPLFIRPHSNLRRHLLYFRYLTTQSKIPQCIYETPQRQLKCFCEVSQTYWGFVKI